MSHVIIGDSRMIVPKNCLDKRDVEIFCVNCAKNVVRRRQKESQCPAECISCTHDTINLFAKKGGICIDLARLLHSYIFSQETDSTML
jgi:hypothetical protein